MDIVLLIIYSIVWYSVGVASFIYWWTSHFDFTSDELSIAALVWFGGPLAWALGWFIHGSNWHNATKVYLKRRV